MGAIMQTRLSLKYRGPAVEAGVMDVYDAAANMIAFSDFVVAAAKSAFGQDIDARAEVAGFGRGSFVTDLVFNVAGPALSLFSAISPDHLLQVISEAVRLWKHLDGNPPVSVQQSPDNQSVAVQNNNGQIINVQVQSLNLVFNEKAAEAVQRFIKAPLLKDGIDRVEIGSEKDRVAEAGQADARCFVPVRPTETITDVTIEMSLTIEAPVFKDGNKWRFHDGANSFHADILDKEFLARVDAGEQFGKGDVLRAEVRITQERSGEHITAARAVVRVIEHRKGAEQTRMF